eukprot:COSAG01_NODE_805_length_13443_cov_81.464928_8_plen_187_part_00
MQAILHGGVLHVRNHNIEPPISTGIPVFGIELVYFSKFVSRDASRGRPLSSDGKQSHPSAPPAEVQMQPRKQPHTLHNWMIVYLLIAQQVRVCHMNRSGRGAHYLQPRRASQSGVNEISNESESDKGREDQQRSTSKVVTPPVWAYQRHNTCEQKRNKPTTTMSAQNIATFVGAPHLCAGSARLRH